MNIRVQHQLKSRFGKGVFWPFCVLLCTAFVAEANAAAVPHLSLSRSAIVVPAVKGENAGEQTFEIWNSGSGTLSYTIDASVDWIACNPTTGSSTGAPDRVTVQFFTDVFGIGEKNAVINVRAIGAANPVESIPVFLTVSASAPKIAASTQSLALECGVGTDAEAPFQIWNSGTGVLSYTVSFSSAVSPSLWSPASSWLEFSSTTGTSTSYGAGEGVIGLNFHTRQFPAGQYAGEIRITAPGAVNNPVVIPVTLAIPGNPRIGLPAKGLAVSATVGGTPPDNRFEVWNAGYGTLSYAVFSSCPWISTVSSTVTSTGEHDAIPLRFNTAGLPVGVYRGSVLVADAKATNSPQNYAVALTVGELSVTTTEGADAATAAFSVTNNGVAAFSYVLSKDVNANWLTFTPGTGTVAAASSSQVTVAFSTHDLLAGTYVATLEVTSSASALASPQRLTVNLTVANGTPSLALGASSLRTTTAHGTNAATQIVDIWNAGKGTLSYFVTTDVNWLQLPVAFGTSAGETHGVPVQFATAGIPVGTYRGQLFFYALLAPQYVVVVPVTLTVASALPTIDLSSGGVHAYCRKGENASPLTLTLGNSGMTTLAAHVSDDTAWLLTDGDYSVAAGRTGPLAIQFQTAGLPVGEYVSWVTVAAAAGAATNSPQTRKIVLTIYSALDSFSSPGLSPADGATAVPPDGNLVMTFAHEVVLQAGRISLYRQDGALWEDISVPSSRVHAEANFVTVTPVKCLLPNTVYYVHVLPGCIQSTLGEDYPGILDANTWSFVTRPRVDADGDGLDDAWEKWYFGDLAASPSEDSDGDGSLNCVEYVTGTPPTGFTMSLKPGWNLLSLPVEPYLPATTQVFAGALQSAIQGDDLVIWTWQSGEANGVFLEVSALAELTGYWFYAGEQMVLDIRRRIQLGELTGYGLDGDVGVTVTVNGRLLRQAQTASLQTGWNLIGVIAPLTINQTAMPNIALPIWGWDASTKSYKAVVDGQKLLPGNGYMVYATSPTTIPLGD